MGENIASPDGHIVLVVTPAGGAQPTYRAHLVVEQNPAKARSIVARHVRAKEIAYVLAAFPEALRQIQGWIPGA